MQSIRNALINVEESIVVSLCPMVYFRARLYG